MVLSRSEANYFIVMGWSMLGLTAVPFITGCVGLSWTNGVDAIVGFTGLYFIAPGVLSLLSGYKQGRAVLGATLATQIMGIILALSCMSISAMYWSGVHYDPLTITNTLVFVLFTILSFTGSILGCATTCFTPQNYISVSSQSGVANEIVVTTSSGQTSQTWSQLPPAYLPEHHQQPTAVENPGNINYVFNDDKVHSGNQLINV